jgi:ferredoxin
LVQLAAIFGVSRSLVHAWEKHRRWPGEELRAALTTFVGYDPYLKAGDHDPRRRTCNMPKLTVEDFGTFEVPTDKRLILALLDEVGVDQLHACGGNARCTTCRVQFLDGEPERMTEAEKSVLAARGLLGNPGLRLSCQILCNHDMAVMAISRFAGSGRASAGNRPADEITPPPIWIPIEESEDLKPPTSGL